MDELFNRLTAVFSNPNSDTTIEQEELTEEQSKIIKKLAYFLWENDGKQPGKDNYYWSLAINKIEQEAYFLWENDGKQPGKDDYYWMLAIEKIKDYISQIEKRSIIKSKTSDKQKDFWDKLDIIGKFLFSMALPGVLAFWSHNFEVQRQEQAKLSRKAEVVVQALSNQDTQRTQIKKDIFQELMTTFLKDPTYTELDINRRILVLQLLALNFTNRQFRLKPLSAYLIKQVEDSPNSNIDDTKKQTYKDKIKKVINNLKSEEIGNVLGSGGFSCDLNIIENQEINLNGQPPCEDIAIPAKIKLIRALDDRIDLEYEDSKNGHKYSLLVTNFDTPFSDNIQIKVNEEESKVDINIIFSVILQESSDANNNADITIVIFPEYFYSNENSSINLDQIIGREFITPILDDTD